MRFNQWLDTFLDEKGIDGDQVLLVDGPSGQNSIPIACLVDVIKQAPKTERDAIKTVIVKIDFRNGDVVPYFEHLAQAIAL